MKTIKKVLIIGSLIFTNTFFSQATETSKKSCTVLDIEYKGPTNGRPIASSSASMGDLTRRELSKLGIYQVTYSQDINNTLSVENINLNTCYDLPCLIKAGKATKSDKMLSGYVEYSSENIVISYREIDVKNEKVTNSITKEFQNLPDQLKNMVILTLQEMYGLPKDEQIEKLLSKELSRDGYINNKGVNQLNLSGVRFGVSHTLGNAGEIIKAPTSQGGFDAYPTMFQFGYQFETMYLNQGRVQALFEFIPTLTGLEQGLFLPSLTMMHGIRDNKSGFEIAFGPTIGLTKKADGYYDNNGDWYLKKEWNDTIANPYPIINRLDSRGDFTINPGFVFAVGFSIKSGNLNLPINAFTVLRQKTLQVGISMGINTKGNK